MSSCISVLRAAARSVPRLRLPVRGWVLAFGGLAALTPVPAVGAAQAAGVSQASNDYADPTTWLCRPARQDACTIDLTTTAVAADGSTTVEPWAPHPDPPIDCFYVYPTVSTDAGPNSDMEPGVEEREVVGAQLARFGSRCRLFAPVYRQITLVGLRAGLFGEPRGDASNTAYADVRDAWNHYLENDNGGRGFVLIGHSQGTGMLVRLIADEIDGRAVGDRLVSALLLGNNVEVPEGADVGGSFQRMPLCRSADQIGCAITYMTFRSTLPPVESMFGRASGEGRAAACTNPAALAGGSGALDGYFGGGSFGGGPVDWTGVPGGTDTEFVRLPGLLRGECVQRGGYSYLEVTVLADPNDPRADDIPGDLTIGGRASPAWGLHLIDAGIAMGNLLDIVERQTAAFLNR